MKKHHLYLILICMVFSLGIVFPALAVTRNDKTVMEFGSSHYRIYNTKTTWKEAVERCSNLGGHLVTINSAEEQKTLETFMTNNKSTVRRYWIGLSDSEREGDWSHWITGEPVTYSNWSKGEPNNGDEKGQDCGSISAESNEFAKLGQWDDVNNNADNNDFDRKVGYICEWESWTCPGCGKTETHNFCEACGHEAPWLSEEK